MSRILVTGAAGLIGKHLTNYLVEQGHEVLAVDDLSNSDPIPEWSDADKVCFLQLDITHEHAVNHLIGAMVENRLRGQRPVEVVYHLAAHPYEGLSQFMPCMVSHTAVIGTLNVLRAAINCGTVKRFVNVSSMARYGSGWLPSYDDAFDDYGIQYGNPPFEEDKHLEISDDVYGHGKVFAEHCVETLCDLHDIEWCHAVPHNVTGEANLKALSDPYRGAMLIWSNQLLRGHSITIFGDGKQKRAPSYVGDIVPALAKMGFAPETKGHVVNLGGSRAYTINEMAGSVVNAYVEVTGRSCAGTKHEPERPCEVKDAWCWVDKSITLLGYKDTTSLDEMAQRIMRWAYSVAPSGLEPRYLDKFEIEKKAPRVWLDKQM